MLTCKPRKGQTINSIFKGLSSSHSEEYKLGLIDCDSPLPSSGKTVIKRFKLNKQKKYSRNNLAFIIAKGKKPKIIPSSYFNALLYYSGSRLQPSITKLDTVRNRTYTRTYV